MAEIVNLRRARKAKTRAAKDCAAEANRVKYGVSRPVRDLARAHAKKAAHDLEANRLNREKDGA